MQGPGLKKPENGGEASNKEVKDDVQRKKAEGGCESGRVGGRSEEASRERGEKSRDCGKNDNENGLEENTSNDAMAGHLEVANANEVSNDGPAEAGNSHTQVVN